MLHIDLFLRRTNICNFVAYVVDACNRLVDMLLSNLLRVKVSSRPYLRVLLSRLVPPQIQQKFYKHFKQMEYDNNEH